VRLANEIDWDWLDGELAGLFSAEGRPATETRFMVGLLLLKHIHQLSDEGVCARWVENPYFQYFTGESFFQHAFPHERSGLSHWRRRIGGKLDALLAESLRVAHALGALKTDDLKRITVDTTVQPKAVTHPSPELAEGRQADADGDRAARPAGAGPRGAAPAILRPGEGSHVSEKSVTRRRSTCHP
jgi:transposase, IS5 family